MHKVFVYGTLRPSLRRKYGFYGNRLPMGAELGGGTIQASLYQISGRVPGIKLTGLGQVVGELVEFTDKEIPLIDALERGYHKTTTMVTLANGDVVQAYVYEMRGNPCNPPVLHGDWARFLEESGYENEGNW